MPARQFELDFHPEVPEKAAHRCRPLHCQPGVAGQQILVHSIQNNLEMLGTRDRGTAQHRQGTVKGRARRPILKAAEKCLSESSANRVVRSGIETGSHKVAISTAILAGAVLSIPDRNHKGARRGSRVIWSDKDHRLDRVPRNRSLQRHYRYIVTSNSVFIVRLNVKADGHLVKSRWVAYIRIEPNIDGTGEGGLSIGKAMRCCQYCP